MSLTLEHTANYFEKKIAGMGRKPCGLPIKKGAWTPLEDQILIDYININGEGKWSKLSKQTGLQRGGKSCRLRWLNYLRPDIKRGNISEEEEELIIRLHKLLGNRWCLIAGRLPSRTDNEIKNYWNTNLSKKVKHQAATSDPSTLFPIRDEAAQRISDAEFQICLSELLDLDIHEFNRTMRSAFGEDLKEQDYDEGEQKTKE